MNKCKYCGKEMKIGFGKRTVFCSVECCKAFYNQPKKKNKTCEICGNALIGKQRRFCSYECKKKAMPKYVYDKDRYKKPKAEVKEKPKRKRGRPKKVLSLAEINARARAEGLNYGAYCTKYGLY